MNKCKNTLFKKTGCFYIYSEYFCPKRIVIEVVWFKYIDSKEQSSQIVTKCERDRHKQGIKELTAGKIVAFKKGV